MTHGFYCTKLSVAIERRMGATFPWKRGFEKTVLRIYVPPGRSHGCMIGYTEGCIALMRAIS